MKFIEKLQKATKDFQVAQGQKEKDNKEVERQIEEMSKKLFDLTERSAAKGFNYIYGPQEEEAILSALIKKLKKEGFKLSWEQIDGKKTLKIEW